MFLTSNDAVYTIAIKLKKPEKKYFQKITFLLLFVVVVVVVLLLLQDVTA